MHYTLLKETIDGRDGGQRLDRDRLMDPSTENELEVKRAHSEPIRRHCGY
jgi:hypothetical protein